MHARTGSDYRPAAADGFETQPTGTDVLTEPALIRRYFPSLTDTTVAYEWLQKTGKAKGFDFAGKPLNDVEMFGEGTGIAVRKGDALKARFNAAIQKVLADGTFAAENKKVFPFSIAPNSK